MQYSDLKARVKNINLTLLDEGMSWTEIREWWSQIEREVNDELCPHHNQIIVPVNHSCTCETIEYHCEACKLVLTTVTECV